MPPIPPTPTYCRPRAYLAFAREVARLDPHGYDALLRAAVAISMHELDDASIGAVEGAVDQLAARVRGRAPSGRTNAVLAHTHRVLFEEEKIIGNAEDYYQPGNSYLPEVLRTKRGLPITLALIYVCVLRRLDVPAVGVNAPGHFLVGMEADGSPLLIDVFAGGRAMSHEEAVERIEQAVGPTHPAERDPLPIATPHQWLARMLANLSHIFHAADRPVDLAAMLELHTLLEEA